MNEEEIIINTIADALGIDDKQNITFKNNIYTIQDLEINQNLRKLCTIKELKDKNIEFWRCIFKKNINLSGLSIETKFEFVDCKFQKDFIARKTEFIKGIIFDSCSFESLIDFCGAKFNSNANFEVSRFKGEAKFIETKFSAKEGKNTFRGSIFEGNIDFSRAEFNSNVNFSISRFKGEAKFIDTKFLAKEGENTFREAMFEGDVVFDSAEFHSNANFSISRFKDETRFIRTIFYGNNNFTETIFEKKAYFQSSGRFDFRFSRFKNEAFFKMNFEEIDFSDSVFISNVIFEDLVFECKNANFKNSNFSNATFENWTLNDCYFDFSNATLGNISFKDKNIDGEKFNFTGTIIKGGADFKNSVIKNINFNKTKFCDYATFENSTFEDADFSQSTFVGSAFFNNTKFKGGSNFLNTIFESNLSFYSAKFEEIPDFGGSISNKGINIANADILKDDIDALRDKIENECKNKNSNDEVNIIANYRDTFKFLKNGAIKENNNFEANNFHRLELYAREEELNKQPKKPKDWADLFVLRFYRILSDHHTDLLKVFNNLILLIALFFIISFKFISYENVLSKNNNTFDANFSNHQALELKTYKNINTENIFIKYENNASNLKQINNNNIAKKDYKFLYFDIFLFIILAMLVYKFRFIYKKTKIYFSQLKDKVALYIAYIKNIKKREIFIILFKKEFLAILLIISIYCFIDFKNINSIHKYRIFKALYIAINIIFINFVFLFSYFVFIYANKMSRKVILTISYLLFLFILSTNISYLAPFVSILVTNKEIFTSNLIISSLSLIYTLLMFLVLFSLQKNSKKKLNCAKLRRIYGKAGYYTRRI